MITNKKSINTGTLNTEFRQPLSLIEREPIKFVLM